MRFLKIEESMLVNIDSIHEIFLSDDFIFFFLKYKQLDSSEHSVKVGIIDDCDIVITEKELEKLKSDVYLLCN